MTSSVPSNLGVFFGKSGQGQEGWYWTDASTIQKPKAGIKGPFETKEQAIENALQSAAAPTPNDERGAA
jgi:hypothetical protein